MSSPNAPSDPVTPASKPPADEPLEIDLRDPYLAAFLAWLLPGAGHFYQRRWGKGGLFMICILGTFFFGLWMGQGRVVYASWRAGDQRYPYLCQIGVGLPALPAIVQSMRMGSNPPSAPLWGGFEAPPLMAGQPVPRRWAQERVAAHDFTDADFPDLDRTDPPEFVPYRRSDMVRSEALPRGYNQLSDWNRTMGAFFEIGTTFTLIAGLLNILAIYDACCGPAGPAPDEPGSETAAKKAGV